MKKTTIILTLLAHLALAQNNRFGYEGTFAPGPFSTPVGREALADAGRDPNSTSSVDFTRANNGEGTPEMWTWRVNITEIPYPDNPRELGLPSASNNSMDLHALNTQWQLEWPGSNTGNASFQSFLASERNESVYFNFIRYSLPSNLTRKYQDQSNGSCAPILGDECARSLSLKASSGDSFLTNNLNGCESTLDVATQLGGLGTATSPSSNMSSEQAMFPGDTLWYYSSPRYEGTNSTILAEAERSLNLLTMAFRPGPGMVSQPVGATVVLCQIVDKDASKSGALGLSKASAAVWMVAIMATLVGTLL